MDSKRLTEIEERCEKATHSTMQMGTKLVRGYWWAMEPATFAVHALRDIPDLVAAYKLLRADAAELARLVDRWQDSSGNLGEFRDRLKVARELLSRPSVINLLKEKDQ